MSATAPLPRPILAYVVAAAPSGREYDRTAVRSQAALLVAIASARRAVVQGRLPDDAQLAVVWQDARLARID